MDNWEQFLRGQFVQQAVRTAAAACRCSGHKPLRKMPRRTCTHCPQVAPLTSFCTEQTSSNLASTRPACKVSIGGREAHRTHFFALQNSVHFSGMPELQKLVSRFRAHAQDSGSSHSLKSRPAKHQWSQGPQSVPP